MKNDLLKFYIKIGARPESAKVNIHGTIEVMLNNRNKYVLYRRYTDGEELARLITHKEYNNWMNNHTLNDTLFEMEYLSNLYNQSYSLLKS